MGIAKTSIAIATGLNDRVNMVHDTVILRDRGTALLTATGMDTELGKIAGLTEEAREPKTPLTELSATCSYKPCFGSLAWTDCPCIPMRDGNSHVGFTKNCLTFIINADVIIPRVYQVGWQKELA